MVGRSEIVEIIEHLQKIGCTRREALIYIEFLRLGATSVQDIARKLKQNRVTVYSAAEQLLKKGLLYETTKGRKRLIGAEEPSILNKILAKREQELIELKGGITKAINLLDAIVPVGTSLPTVKFYEDTDGFKKMLEETLTARGEILVFTYVDLFSNLLGANYLERYFQRRAAKGIHTRLIFPPCPFADKVTKKSLEYKIQVKTLPAGMHWRSGIFSWNDCLAIKSFTEGKLTTTIIENKDIAHFYRNIIFELVWKQATRA